MSAPAASLAVPRQRTTIQVREAGAADAQRWDAFVLGQSRATFFHRAGWRDVLQDLFGHRAHYLYAEMDGQICGILPLAQMRSRIFGHSLVSTPFCVYGGIVADSAAAEAALAGAARERAEELDVDYLELRNRAPLPGDWIGKDLYVTYRKEISADSEENLAGIPRKQRAVVRKGIAGELVSGIDDNVMDLYRCYSESVRNLGTPVFARRYLRRLHETFGDDCEVLSVRKDGKAVASVMSFYFRDEVLPYYGGGKAEARRLHANDFLYWELMRRAPERGVRVFDYGRSKKDSGSGRFKKHWGFVPEPLYYQYHLVRAQDMPDLSPANPKYRFAIGAWKRLPLPVATALGPWLARHLG